MPTPKETHTRRNALLHTPVRVVITGSVASEKNSDELGRQWKMTDREKLAKERTEDEVYNRTEADAPSFRELAKKHGLKQLSEEKYRVNVKVVSRRRSKKT